MTNHKKFLLESQKVFFLKPPPLCFYSNSPGFSAESSKVLPGTVQTGPPRVSKTVSQHVSSGISGKIRSEIPLHCFFFAETPKGNPQETF